MKMLGRHLIAEFANCDRQKLDDEQFVKECMLEAVRKSGATIVNTAFHRYAPQGVSGVVVIAESHMSIHTWPEYGYAAVDFFTCGPTVDPHAAYQYIKKMLNSRDDTVTILDRGIPSKEEEVINHKSALASQNVLSVAKL